MANINDFKGIPPLTWTFIVAMVIGSIIPKGHRDRYVDSLIH